MSNFGIPYMGSKAKICDKVCLLFPRADNFYDLFGGGFSITHFMLERRSSHYKQFHFNELRPGVPDLIKKAINGDFNYKVYNPPWVSREEFFAKKEIDPMIKIIWSFGNNGRSYLFGKDIEQQKKSLHQAIVFNEFDETAKEIFGIDGFKEGYGINQKRLYLRSRQKFLNKDIEQLEQLQQHEQLERLEQLQRLEQLEQLHFYNTSYENVPVRENSVIYCDIPYGGTAEYDKSSTSFDRRKFFDWADDQENPVFISEYNVEDSRFKCIANFEKRSMLSATKDNTLIKTEKVYVNKVGYKILISRKVNNG